MKDSKLGKTLISIGVILLLVFALLIGLQVIMWALKYIIIGALIMLGIIFTGSILNKKSGSQKK